MPIPIYNEGPSIDWSNWSPSLAELMEAARNLGPRELPSPNPDQVQRALMHVPPGQSDVDIDDLVLPLQSNLADVPTPGQYIARSPSNFGERTPTNLTDGEGYVETNSTATTVHRETTARDSGPSRDQQDALLDYENTLARLYDATMDRANMDRESGTGRYRYIGPYGNAAVSNGTTIYDPATRWLLIYALMASFSRLHPSQVAQPVGFPDSRSTFQNVVWELWLVVQRGDRDALWRLDQALRGSPG